MWVDAWSIQGFKPLVSRACIQENVNAFKWIMYSCLGSLCNQGIFLHWKADIGDVIKPWNSVKMCEITNRRNIMFVGDSVQVILPIHLSFVSPLQICLLLNEDITNTLYACSHPIQFQLFVTMASTLLSETYTTFDNNTDPDIIAKRQNDAWLQCDGLCAWRNHNCEMNINVDCGSGNSFSLSYVKEHHLKGFDGNGNEAEWIQKIRSRNVSLLLINTGPHFLDNSIKLPHLNESLAYVYKTFPNISIIYRNTPDPTENCGSSFISMPSRDVKNKAVAHPDHPEWRWEDLASQNDAIRGLLKTYFPQVFYIDIASPQAYRLDSHPSSGDCLHYCVTMNLFNLFT